jgi:hypothetical protein
MVETAGVGPCKGTGGGTTAETADGQLLILWQTYAGLDFRELQYLCTYFIYLGYLCAYLSPRDTLHQGTWHVP